MLIAAVIVWLVALNDEGACIWIKRAIGDEAAVDSAATLPTPVELQAAYRQNLQRLGHLRIVYEVVLQTEAALRESVAAELRFCEDALRTAPVDHSQRESLTARVDRLREQLEDLSKSDPLPPMRRIHDFWTDQVCFQYRTPRLDLSEEPPLPDLRPLSSEDLANHFTAFNVLSWCPEQRNKCWFWNGVNPKSGEPGGVTAADVHEVFTAPFPVLGYVKSEWGRGHLWHPIDRLFACDLGSYRTIAVEYRGDDVVYIVEGPDEARNARREKEDIQWAVRARINASQGCIPERVQAIARKAAADGGVESDRVVEDCETVAILRAEGGAFYPQVTRQYDLRMDWTTYRGPNQESPAELCVARTTTVRTVKIAEQLDLEREMFRLEFPDGTRYFDKEAGQVFTSGPAEEAIASVMRRPPRASQRLTPAEGPAQSRGWWLVLLNLVVVGLVGGAYLIQRRVARRRQA